MSQAAGQVGDQERSGLGAALVMAGECSSEEDDREQAGRHRRHKRKHRHKRKRRHGESERTTLGGGGEGARPPEGTKEVEAAPSLARDREQRQSHGLEWMTLPTRRRPGSEKESEAGDSADHAKVSQQGGGVEPSKPPVGLWNPKGNNPVGTSSVSKNPGDGGASWRAKAMRRAKERAREEGRPVSEVVDERWGGSEPRGGGNEPRGDGARSVNRRSYNDSLSWRPRKSQPQAHPPASTGEPATTGSPQPSIAAASNGDPRTAADLLRARLAAAANPGAAGAALSVSGPKEILLPSVTREGKLISSSSVPRRARGPQGGQKFRSHGEDGARLSYFADDDGAELADLVREERRGEAAAADDLIGSHISKRKNFKPEHLGVDEEYDNDGALGVLGRTQERGKKRRGGNGGGISEEEAARQRQVQAFQRAERQQQSCVLCLQNPNRPRHLVVAIGQTSYLRLPSPKRSACQGHCLIVPMEHIPCTRVADDNTLGDMRNFKKSLVSPQAPPLSLFPGVAFPMLTRSLCLSPPQVQMFASMNYGVVFLELGGKRGHVSVEAVPVPLGRMPSVPLLFKNEFAQRSDELNSAFHSKHLIETGGKTIQDKIPEGFPYYWVTFGLVSGVLADLGGARGGLTSLLISSFAGQGLPPRHRRGPEGLRGSWGSRAEVCCLARRGQRARGVPQRLLRLRLDQAAAGGVSPVIGLFVL